MSYKDAINYEQIQKEIERMNTNYKDTGNDDDRFWQPTVDKAGNGTATIRFLPTPPSDLPDGLPWVKIFSHGFQGPTGKWYIANSLSTLGQPDPVMEMNSKLWNSGLESARNFVSNPKGGGSKRKLQYVSNILVIKDEAKPENEGKVFLFRYGAKLFDKLEAAMKPKSEEIDPINPFDIGKTGANLILIIKKVDGYRNYDDSTFGKIRAVANDEKVLDQIWEKGYSLKEFIAPDKFKSYDELKKYLDRVMGENQKPERADVDYSASNDGGSMDDDIPFLSDDSNTRDDDSSDVATTVEDSDDDDAALAHFKSLLDE